MTGVKLGLLDATPVKKPKPPKLKDTATVRTLREFQAKPVWTGGTARIVERQGQRYLCLSLGGQAIEVHTKAQREWLRARLDDFAQNEGDIAKSYEVDVPIAVGE